MATPPSPNRAPSSSSLRAVPYEETTTGTLPLLVAATSSSQSLDSESRSDKSPNASRSAPSTPVTLSRRFMEDLRRDSGLAPSSHAGGDNSKATLSADDVSSLKTPRSIPSIVVDEDSPRPSSRRSERLWNSLRGRKSEDSKRPAVPPLPPPEEPFRGIALDIPSSSFEDLSNTVGSMKFSKRGSVLKNRSNQNLEVNGTNGTNDSRSTSPARSNTRRIRSNNSLRPRPSSATTKALSVDEEILSQRVRLMYSRGHDEVSEAEVTEILGLDGSDAAVEERSNGGVDTDLSTINSSGGGLSRTQSTTTVNDIAKAENFIKKETTELAGGLEDWENVQAGDVDRYGFIIPRKSEGDDSSAPQPLQRVSTSLMLAAASPRRKRTIRRAPSDAASTRSFAGRSPTIRSSEQGNRPSSSQSSYQGTRSTSRLRYAANKLPHNKNRKFVDEAADMLTNPDHVKDEDDDNSPYARALRKKEWEREDKWQKMAKLTSKKHDGSGMSFEFDVKSSKLIERTWKGIPDRWRATAWHAFLSASAKKRKDCLSDQELIDKYNELQHEPSPDDVQIDIDVPRTISSHIMFRRRYRGGQRLLFRVLHAMSLYFPDTGYVQGMAALAATLLAYYDEEHAFIMLVRLWQLRGLDRLYRSGFSGLMEALNNFERDWLDGGEVAEKLTELGIPPTAYGTRWYLTLFNYSIPFPAQLRVWDVFMLLGDADEPTPAPSRPATSSRSVNDNASTLQAQPNASPFGRSLDVLHATSAALIDGMRDIILESDFENAMKVLTSWVPIKDVELFMRVARAEWKVHYRKKP